MYIYTFLVDLGFINCVDNKKCVVVKLNFHDDTILQVHDSLQHEIFQILSDLYYTYM